MLLHDRLVQGGTFGVTVVECGNGVGVAAVPDRDGDVAA
jgi:hypothetical protein